MQNNVAILSESVEQYKSRTERFLKRQLNNADIAEPQLKSAMEYSLLLGGKRLRPFLVYATGELFDVPVAELDYVAGALEAIHSYSLIHDDLPAMDDDDLRRGQVTCHKKFDEATAILAGDTLQSFAFQLLSTNSFENITATEQVKLIALISQAATHMCAGQSIDLLETDALPSEINSEEKELRLNALKHMHSLKTGALIKVSVLAGAISGKANEKDIKHLTEYAQSIGLAFQVWDDVLDIISDTETLGKPQGSDSDANKTTYPALLGLEQAKQKAQNLVQQAVQALQQLPYDTAVLEQLAFYIIERDH